MALVPLVAAFLVLSVGGLVNASYLAWQHRSGTPLVCPMNHDCRTVTESSWASLFGVRNEVLGLLFFLGMLSGMLLALAVPAWEGLLHVWFLLGAAGGVLFSLFLMGVQVWALKDYCFYCLVSAGITVFLFLDSLLLYTGYT